MAQLQLNAGDHVLMCEHLVKRYWCNVRHSARMPERLYWKEGGKFERDDGTKGHCRMVASCRPTPHLLWEVIWDGERFQLADAALMKEGTD